MVGDEAGRVETSASESRRKTLLFPEFTPVIEQVLRLGRKMEKVADEDIMMTEYIDVFLDFGERVSKASWGGRIRGSNTSSDVDCVGQAFA